MDNTQATEDQNIQAQLDAIASNAPPELGAGPLPPQAPAEQPMDWRMAASGLVLIMDRVVAPNWDLEAAEKDALAMGFEQVLGAFFPTTNIDPRVQALLALGGIMIAITAKRTDMSTGKVTPLRKPRETKPEESRAPFAAAA